MAAKTKAEVDAQSAADRAWDSLNYSYDQKAKKINQNYDKAYSQASNQQLARGMQRSSYANQVLAGVNQQRNQALSDNEDALIADYQKWRYQIDRDEVEDSKWWNEFNEKARQFNATHELNRDIASNNYNVQLEQLNQSAQRLALDNTIASNNYNIANMQNWISQQGVNNDYALGLAKLEQGDKSLALDELKESNRHNETLAQQALTKELTSAELTQKQSQFEASQAQTKELTEAELAEKRRQFDEGLKQKNSQFSDEMAYKYAALALDDKQGAEQLKLEYDKLAQQNDQFEKEIDYNKAASDQKYAYESAMTLIQNGRMPSAELLAMAGITNADDLAALQAIADHNLSQLTGTGSSSGGGGSGSSGGSGDNKGNGDKQETSEEFLARIGLTKEQFGNAWNASANSAKDTLNAAKDTYNQNILNQINKFFTPKSDNHTPTGRNGTNAAAKNSKDDDIKKIK